MNRNSGNGAGHDVEVALAAIAAKLHAKADTLAHADDHFTLDIYRKGVGYDIKLKTTI